MLVVAGGDGDSDELDTVELLPSLTAPAWQAAAPSLPYRVRDARMTAVDGRLLLTGGWDGNNHRTGECWPPRPARPDSSLYRDPGV